MYSWSKDWPTLTELFFGKGNGPRGKLNGMTAEKPAKKAKKADPKTGMMTKNPGIKIPKKSKK
ncbi:uncharacterized protein METZ01_LOCUS77123 [marine metagenome]|uniref:Uncharacterized protein n=1 Tax=marine metagenome TaxID=408172 RepID=A0A381U7Z2_9ZZZZ